MFSQYQIKPKGSDVVFFFFDDKIKKKIIIDAEYSSRTESIFRRHLAFCQIFNMYSLG